MQLGYFAVIFRCKAEVCNEYKDQPNSSFLGHGIFHHIGHRLTKVSDARITAWSKSDFAVFCLRIMAHPKFCVGHSLVSHRAT